MGNTGKGILGNIILAKLTHYKATTTPIYGRRGGEGINGALQGCFSASSNCYLSLPPVALYSVALYCNASQCVILFLVSPVLT